MSGIGREIGHFLTGVMFLTRLPTPPVAHEEGRLARSARYFPLIGAVVGVIAGGVFALASAPTTVLGSTSALRVELSGLAVAVDVGVALHEPDALVQAIGCVARRP